MADDRYDRVTFHGKTVDKYTRAALLEAERRLGYELTIVQGSYHGGVSVSAGTHDGGGVVDLLAWDHARKVRVLREVGFAAWYRPTIPGLWGEHIHAVLLGNAKASPSAQNQMSSYRRGRNGLKGDGIDPTWRPNPIPTFDYAAGPAPRPTGLRVHGVDISHHQDGRIDYSAALDAGVRFVWHKATEGATYRDPNYGRRRGEVYAARHPNPAMRLLRAEMLFGGYHFARPAVGDAVTEARHFLDVARPQPGDLAPALDLETTEGLSLDRLDVWAVTWGKTVKDAVGGPLVLYTPFNLPKARDVFDFVWRPRYNNDNRPPELPWDIFQFSNGELGVPNQVAGFGHVDLNHMRDGLTVKQLRLPPAPPAPEPEPTPEPDLEPGVTLRRVAILNVQSVPLMSAEKVRADLAKARELAGVLMLQEIEPDYYKDIVREAVDSTEWEVDHLDREVPIMWRRRSWERVSGAEVKTHDGKAGVSPNRYVVWTILRDRENGAEVAFVNTHMVSAAWSDRPVEAKAWRREMWTQHFRAQVGVISGLVAARHTVVGGGDHNRVDLPKFHPGQKWIASSGIDDLYRVPASGGSTISVDTDEKVGGFNSDHDMKRAWLRVTA